MARPRYALTKQLADELLARAGCTEPPVDVVRLATEFCEVDLRVDQFDGDMDGALIREPEQQPIIAINSRGRSEQRQRFTVAHEIGHLLLHSSSYHVDTKVHLRNAASSTAEFTEEIEANQFASNLMMPDWMLKASIEEQGAMDEEELASALADRYNVSLQSMTLRLAKFLKYQL